MKRYVSTFKTAEMLKEEILLEDMDYIALGQAILATLPVMGALVYNKKIGELSDKGIDAINGFIAKHEKKIKGMTPEIVLKAFQKMKDFDEGDWAPMKKKK